MPTKRKKKNLEGRPGEGKKKRKEKNPSPKPKAGGTPPLASGRGGGGHCHDPPYLTQGIKRKKGEQPSSSPLLLSPSEIRKKEGSLGIPTCGEGKKKKA